VSVIATKDVPVYERYYETFNPGGFLGEFRIPRVRENGTQEREVGGGSGFIVSYDGLIVTNHHVVADQNARYSVVLTDGTVYQTEVLDSDSRLDIALLKITEPLTKKLSVLTFGSSEELQLGQTVIAIGNALAEFQNSVSVGVISGLSRSIIASDGMGSTEQLNQVIQTDAAINPGNSGGPLLNISGQVIGVNVATSRSADNIGFALPGTIVKQAVQAVQKYGELAWPFLGVRYAMITNELSEENQLEVDYGALIIGSENNPAILPGSPAEAAGLKNGDIILSVTGELVQTVDLAEMLRLRSIGETIELEVLSDGVVKKITVTLGKTV